MLHELRAGDQPVWLRPLGVLDTVVAGRPAKALMLSPAKGAGDLKKREKTARYRLPNIALSTLRMSPSRPVGLASSRGSGPGSSGCGRGGGTGTGGGAVVGLPGCWEVSKATRNSLA